MTGYIYGRVTYRGRPVAAAYVSMANYKAKTGTDGVYRLGQVLPDRWTVAIWYGGHNYLQRISVYPGPNRRDFEIAELYALY